MDPRAPARVDPATSLREAVIAAADATILDVRLNRPLHASAFWRTSRGPRVLIAEAHAVLLQRGAREQMDTVSEVTLVFERAIGAAPQRSVTTPSGTEQIELLGRALALCDDGDVFGEEDLL